MYIKKLNLTNFIGLSREIEFSPRFNIIIGVNGSGKTRVLEALRLLLSDLIPRFAAARVPGRYNKNRSNISIDEISFGKEFLMADIFFTSVDNIDYRYEVEHKKSSLSTYAQLNKKIYANFGKLTPAKPESYFVELQNSKNQPLALFYSAKRMGEKYKTLGYAVKKEEYNNGYFLCLHPDGDMFSGIDIWWMNKEALTEDKQLDSVRNAMKIIFPEIVDWSIFDHELHFQKIFKVTRLNSETGESFEQEERASFRFKDLSHGEQTMALFGLDIARRLAQLNPFESDPISNGCGIVLIDELDLHLHPQWQRRIVECLCKAFPKLQFICTTHSPFLIQSQRIGNLIRLDEDGNEEVAAVQFNQQSIEDIVEDVQGVELPQKSKRYLDMMKAAEHYYRRLHEIADESDPQLTTLRKRLDELSIPFGDDPAFAALLKYEKETVATDKARMP